MKKHIKSFIKSLIPQNFHKRAYYFGYGRECPLCRSHFRKFAPYVHKYAVLEQKEVVGGMQTLNGRCPVCDCHNRARLLFLFLSYKTDIFRRPQKLLHIAPEKQISKVLRKTKGLDYLAADLMPKEFIIKMDLTSIQFSDNTFDAVICCHVLEHIIDDRKAMCELYRTLKPGGWAILQVPLSLSLKQTYEDFSITSAEGRAEAFGQEDHVRIYAQDYKDRLEQVGFKVEIFHWNNEVGALGNLKNKFGLDEKEGVYLARK